MTNFPLPKKMNGRLLFDRHELENFKRELIGLPPLERDPNAPIEFATSNTVAAEFGFGRRTLGRRIVAASAAKSA